MGTNYYLYEREPCQCCGRGYDPLHIGKSSGGWCFALHVDPDSGINDLPDWERLWGGDGTLIQDEYGVIHSLDAMRSIICNRSWRAGGHRTPKYYADNHAEPGPSGLLRSRIDDRHCIGHGEGTWDLIVGEFS